MTDLGNELARLRREKDLSQQELADILRVSRQAVSRWENGTAIPTMENMIFLARLHDVQLDELVDGRKEGSGGEWRTAEGKAAAAPEEPRRGTWKDKARWALLLLCAFALGAMICLAVVRERAKEGPLDLMKDTVKEVNPVSEGEFSIQW
ncbi:helix-turn-helix transcriptional regulator [uncultured Dysosmobacter sp.]|uniref:helix-turn-helix transcriptional regulator n=1 Tax=uncultured Dysosmobacter sp. TaxID=2591384 RepID=UPI0026325CD4|nr:helix-turn-helix transcriptional regulator [uncultured Dysosmobacter sp.]